MKLIFQVRECARILNRRKFNQAISQPLFRDGKIKVLLADDHEVMRKGLRKVIEEEEDFVVVGEACNGKEAVELARETTPDIIVMDVRMPVMNGIQATRKISAEMPSVPIIGLSLWGFTMVGRRMKRAGASVYLRKDKAFETLCAAIRKEVGARD